MTGTVLYVEDDRALAVTVQHMLRRALPDVHVIHVMSVAAAINALGVCVMDLVLSDYNVHGALTGGDLLDHVLAMRNAPPFVFLSSDERCAGRGVPWLRKPCEPAAIRGAVMAAIDPPKVVVDVPLEVAR